MDKYAVFGLLLITHLGLAQDIRIDLISPVIQHDDVNITCKWTSQDTLEYSVVWWRQTTASTNEDTQLYNFSTIGSSPQLGFEFVSRSWVVAMTHYTIKLLGAEKQDEGTYWCTLKNVHGYYDSGKKQLNVTVPQTTMPTETTTTAPAAMSQVTSDINITPGDTSFANTGPSGVGQNSRAVVQGPSVGVIAGSVASGVVVLVAVISAVIVCKHRRNTQEETEMVENDVHAGFTGNSNPASNDLEIQSEATMPPQNAEGPYSYIPEQTASAKASSGPGHPSADGKPQGEQARQAPKAVSGTALQDAQGNSSDKNAAKKTRTGKAVAEKKATKSDQATRVGKQTTDVDARVSGAKRATAVPQYANVDRLVLPDTKPKAGDADEEAQYDTIEDTMMQEDEDVAKNETTNDKAKQHKRNHGNQPSKFAESKGSNEAQYAQVDKAKRKPAAKEAIQNLKHTNDANAIRKMPAKYEHPEVQYAQVDKSKKTTAAKETKQVVHHAQVDDTKKQQNATEVNEEAQHAQTADKTEKESGPREGSHYAQVAATGDGKGVIVRTVPDTEYSAVTLSAKADQEVDSDSD